MNPENYNKTVTSQELCHAGKALDWLFSPDALLPEGKPLILINPAGDMAISAAQTSSGLRIIAGTLYIT